MVLKVSLSSPIAANKTRKTGSSGFFLLTPGVPDSGQTGKHSGDSSTFIVRNT